MALRADLALISEWIRPKAHILDLGCGDGRLLAHLRETRQVSGYGLEINDDNILNCIRAGVNVIHFDLNDLNKGLCDFNEDSFDYVVMTQALQTVRYPDFLLMEMLRVGQEGIVTFPNFGHWSCRLSIGVQGRMPISPALPHEWFDTENIHLCTIRDFERLCDSLGIEILQRSVVDPDHNTRPLMRLLPNLFGEIALYRFRRRHISRFKRQ
jgi:methionine biosynthesis protein MetW